MTVKRLQNESEKNYEMLKTYLSMGFGRSVAELARTYEVSRQHIYDLMKKFDWKSRIASQDEKILAEIREDHNSTFQSDALLRRENLVKAYSLLQRTFSKMLSYSDKYTSNTMEPDEFLNKTDKLFRIIQRYEKISQSCEKYLAKFGIETVGQVDELSEKTEEVNQEIEEFNLENNDLEENASDDLLRIDEIMPEINEDFELTEQELEEIDLEVENNFPAELSENERENFRNNLIMKKMKNKYDLVVGG